CAAIKDGDAGGVTGVRQSDDSILASFVSLTTPSPFPVTFSGNVSSLAGPCPALVLTIGLIGVETDEVATFHGHACDDLRRGDAVTVGGTRRSSGPVKAEQIDYGAGSSTPSTASVFGTVESLSGACPALTMTINGTTVTTTSGTFFGVNGCGGIRTGY